MDILTELAKHGSYTSVFFSSKIHRSRGFLIEILGVYLGKYNINNIYAIVVYEHRTENYYDHN